MSIGYLTLPSWLDENSFLKPFVEQTLSPITNPALEPEKRRLVRLFGAAFEEVGCCDERIHILALAVLAIRQHPPRRDAFDAILSHAVPSTWHETGFSYKHVAFFLKAIRLHIPDDISDEPTNPEKEPTFEPSSSDIVNLNMNVVPTDRKCPSLKDLIEQYSSKWSGTKYEETCFKSSQFIALAKKNKKMFPLVCNYDTDAGFIEKKVVSAATRIFVRADLHGDLHSLIENLRALQNQGLLDSAFRCTKNTHLVFLGDYADRGQHSMEVLQILVTLRLENRTSVTLIRGNHESIDLNRAYASGRDKHFQKFLCSIGEDGKYSFDTYLKMVYDTMPLCIFIGQRSEGAPTQYVLFTHGLFELYADPIPMFEVDASRTKMIIPQAPLEDSSGVSSLKSERISSIPFDPEVNYQAAVACAEKGPRRKALKLAWAAQRIDTLMRSDVRISKDAQLTSYNWGDMSLDNTSSTDSLGTRNWYLGEDDVKHYFRLISSDQSKVKFMFRGHQHIQMDFHHKKKGLVSTLPVGMDTDYAQKAYPWQSDTTCLLTTAPKIDDWVKQMVCRDRDSRTVISRPTSLRRKG